MESEQPQQDQPSTESITVISGPAVLLIAGLIQQQGNQEVAALLVRDAVLRGAL